MKYISVKETAKILNISERSVRNYCINGRINGAKLEGKTWLIPENVKKPDRKNKDDFLPIAKECLNFINKSPVNFYAIQNVEDELINAGYKKLDERKINKISKGDKIFFKRNGTSIVALNIGKNIEENSFPFHIIASHSDSPTFKIKPNADGRADIYNKINVEPYGGMICSTWLDRPLSIAGRVVINKNNKIETKLINIDKDLLCIPNLCIHFNRNINTGYAYDMASDMQPMISQELEGQVLKNLLSETLKVKADEIMNYDLYLYNREIGTIWGPNDEYISSGRLDDLECVFTSMKAFKESGNDNAINVLFIADNEEVGSGTAQGADGDFIQTILYKVCKQLGFSDDSFNVAVTNSFLISADNAHSVHPNNLGITDGNNRCFMNKGIAIKFNAAQSYTSDGVSSAVFQKICEDSNVPYQFFTNRANVRGGSTLGNILLSHISLKSVDIGLPQLAMHSSFETAGVKDVKFAFDAFKKFYSSNICFEENSFIIK